MALNKALIALTCVVTFPIAALAQSAAWTIPDEPGCCATASDDRSALAASVLLPPASTLAADEGATALAASVLLPADCCGSGAKPDAALAVDDCCHGMKDDACCAGMKEACGMPCCQTMRPTR